MITSQSALPLHPPRIGTILCAIDQSPVASSVLYTGAGLAADPESTLVILRVADEDDGTALRDFVQTAIPGWMSYRAGTMTMTRRGDPAKVILSVAGECDARMIVMGTHGRHGLTRMLFGSVTASVLAGANMPVAVVPPSEPELISLSGERAIPHLGSVLVPVDLSADVDRQLAFASTLATASSREVTLLHAIPEGADSSAPLGRLRDLAARMRPHDVRAVVTHGPVVNVIRHRQRRCGAGVVVLGRDAGAPGKLACELLQDTGAVVIFVP